MTFDSLCVIANAVKQIEDSTKSIQKIQIDVWIASFLAMTRSDDRSPVPKGRHIINPTQAWRSVGRQQTRKQT